MENKTFLEKLKFGIGDGNLQYYLYNWKCPSMGSEKVFFFNLWHIMAISKVSKNPLFAFLTPPCLVLSGWVSAAVTSLHAINKCHQQARRPHHRTDHPTDGVMTSCFRKGRPTAHFYFLTFWTLTCTTAARQGGGESLPALPPPSIT